MTYPTISDAERAFARTEATPTNRAYYDAATHSACLIGACVVAAHGPVEPRRYVPLMCALFGISASQAASLESGFNAGLDGKRLDPAQFATPGYRRGVEIGGHIRTLYSMEVAA